MRPAPYQPIGGRRPTWRRGLARVLAAGLLVCAGGVAALAADPVAVRAGAHDGFGRIVFDWKAPVEFAVRSEGRRLVVEFERPMTASFDAVLRRLRPYVRDARLEDGGRRVVFTLTRPFAHRAFVNEGSVVVDVVGRAGATGPGAGAEAKPLPVRVGEHVGFSRLVFDWARPVDYKILRDGATVTVAFSQPARIDIAKLKADLPERVEAVEPAPPDPGVALRLTLPESARLRHFRSGTRVVVDVLGPGGAPAPSAGARPAPPQAPPPVPLAKPKDAARTEPDAPGAKPQTSAPRHAAPAPSPGARRATPAAILVPSAGDGPKALAAAAAPGAQPKAAGQKQTLAVGAEVDDGTLRLRFDWPEPVAAAAYRRAGALWVVFDREAALDLTAVTSAARKLAMKADQISFAGATILRLEVQPGTNPSVERDGPAWIVELKPQGLQPDEPIRVEAQPRAPSGPRVLLSVADVGRKLEIRDPEVGDTIVVLPVAAGGHGIEGTRRYAQFVLPATAQGIVVEPRADDVRVRTAGDGVEITSATRLYLSDRTPPSQGQARSTASRRGRPARAARGLFDFDAWLGPEGADFSTARQALQRAVVVADEQDLNLARLDLGRFYFAHGFAAEALGLIRTIDAEDPNMADDPAYRALRGACEYLVGDYEAAGEDLFHPSLDGEPEAMFWRGLLAASQRQWSTAARSFSKVGDTVQFYPREHKVRFGLLAAETALAVGELGAAKVYIDFVEESGPDLAAKYRAKYLLGWWLEKLGDRDKAFEVWDEVAKGPDRASEARAKFAKVVLRFDDGEISVPEAIDQLERLRFSWRGDAFEFDLLRRLGELYLSAGDYLRGLTTLKQAVTHFPQFEESRVVAQKMSDAFVELYSDGAADSLSPITALAIYREFRELTPAGEKGDEIARKLAERLVAVDLLDQAAELLDQQVKYRLKGPEKARVGLRLAMIRLLDKKPKLALEALRGSAAPGLAEEIVAERRLVEARALSDLGRSREALALIRGDRTPAADLLRVDIHWREHDWARAAAVLARLVENDVQPGADLDEAQAATILRLAVAVSLSDDRPGLARLRARYAAAMDATPLADEFRVVTSAPGGNVTTVEALAARLAEVDQFGAFMVGYREQFQSAEVAAVN